MGWILSVIAGLVTSLQSTGKRYTVGRYFSVAYNFREIREFEAKSRKLKSRN